MIGVDKATQTPNDGRVDEWLSNFEHSRQAQGLHHDLVLELVILRLDEILVECRGESQDYGVDDDHPYEPVLLALAVVDVQEGVPPEKEWVEQALEEC